MLDGVPIRGPRSALVEFIVFVLKQAWACVFGAAILFVLIATKLSYPDGAALARNDFVVIAAVAIEDGWQVVSLAKLGSWFLLMIISVVLVAWVYPPRPSDPSEPELA